MPKITGTAEPGRLAQLRAGFPVEISAYWLPPDARPADGQGLVVVNPDNTVAAFRRGYDTAEWMYEIGESDQFGTPDEYAKYLYGKYYAGAETSAGRVVC